MVGVFFFLSSWLLCVAGGGVVYIGEEEEKQEKNVLACRIEFSFIFYNFSERAFFELLNRVVFLLIIQKSGRIQMEHYISKNRELNSL